MSRTGALGFLDHVEEFLGAARRTVALVAATDLRLPAEGCPGWTCSDVVVHLGNVHGWAATILETGGPAPRQHDRPRSLRPHVLAGWYAAKAEDLYRVLRSTEPRRPCWTLDASDGTSGFWARRMAHETVVHALDLDLAAGRTVDVPAALAEDGVDEVLTVFLPRLHRQGSPVPLTAPLCLVSQDSGRAWTLTPRPQAPWPLVVPEQPAGPPAGRGSSRAGPPGRVPAADVRPPLVVGRRHPAADTLAAPAQLLYLALWGRTSWERVSRSGDPARVEAFLGSRLTP